MGKEPVDNVKALKENPVSWISKEAFSEPNLYAVVGRDTASVSIALSKKFVNRINKRINNAITKG